MKKSSLAAYRAVRPRKNHTRDVSPFCAVTPDESRFKVVGEEEVQSGAALPEVLQLPEDVNEVEQEEKRWKDQEGEIIPQKAGVAEFTRSSNRSMDVLSRNGSRTKPASLDLGKSRADPMSSSEDEGEELYMTPISPAGGGMARTGDTNERWSTGMILARQSESLDDMCILFSCIYIRRTVI
jgi:hypothetical protein